MTPHPLRNLVVAYAGNFIPAHSTETHVADAFEHLGATVVRMQENEATTWRALPHVRADLVLWTRTWSWRDHLAAAGDALAAVTAPKVGFHLDRLWGLNREHLILGTHPDPFFTATDLLVTADGGHDDRWADAGIRHAWLPPAIARAEAERVGVRRQKYRTRLAFVGSWGEYHSEWKHRRELVLWARTRYQRSIGLWPQVRTPAVRGQDLSDLYASVDVVLGDSCLAGGATRYWSDRIPETLGRGGFLIHPNVEGLDEHFKVGEHLVTWDVGDWSDLQAKVEHYLEDGPGRAAIAEAGRAHVMAEHLYEHRAARIVDLVEAL